MQEEISPNGQTFSMQLMKLMSDAGINKRQLAIEIGVTPAAMGRYVDGRVPRADELLRIARHFKVPMEQLLTGIGDGSELVTNKVDAQTQEWRDRARDAEAKVEVLKCGLMSLLKKI